MSTVTSNRTRTARRSPARPGRPDPVVVVSVDELDAWLRDEGPRLRALAARPAASGSALAERHDALAELHHVVAVLDQLALDPLPHHADPDLVGWLHTCASALADALTATAEHRVLGRAA